MMQQQSTIIQTMFQPYEFSAQQIINIKAFQYRTGKPVLSYTYLWSPMAQLFLPYLPLTLAPNLITLIAFIFSMMGGIPLFYYSYQRPDWSVLFFAVCLFIYQQLDNLDGKQARRTNTSSPLGMLFDHGLDTITAYSLTLSVSAMLGSDDTFQIVLIFILISSGFYIGTLWQYYTKVMDFGIYSPPDDGIPTLYMLALLVYWTGKQFWAELYYGVHLRVWVGYGICGIAFFFIGSFMIYSLIKMGFKFLYNCTNMLLMILVTIICYPTISKALFPYLITYLFTLGRTTNLMQIGIITDGPFRQFSKTLFLFMICTLVGHWLSVQQVGLDQKWYFVTIGVVLIVNYSVFAVGVAKKMSQILKIPIFTIKTKNN